MQYLYNVNLKDYTTFHVGGGWLIVFIFPNRLMNY